MFGILGRLSAFLATLSMFRFFADSSLSLLVFVS